MPVISNFLHDAILNQLFRASAFTPTGVLAMALSTSLITAEDDGTSINEPAFAYARQTTNFNVAAANWASSDNGTYNAKTVTFPQATGDWASPLAWAVTDNATSAAGKVYFFGDLTNPAPISASSTPASFTPGTIKVRMDKGAIINNDLHDKILNLLFRGDAYTWATTLYLALCSNELPTAEDTGGSITEPAGSGYARQNITPGTVTWALSDCGTFNQTAISFPQATGSWGNIVGWAICKDITGGDVLFQGPVKTPRAIAATSPPVSFSPGTFILSLDGLVGGS